MTFTEHLSELRTRIIRSGVALVLGFVVCYALSEQLFNLVRSPLMPPENTGINSQGDAHNADSEKGQERNVEWFAGNFLEPVFVKLKLAGFGGALLMSPYIIYQICAFIFPGLKAREKRIIRILLMGCGTLAIIGVGVAYFGIFRFLLPYLLEWTPEGVVTRLRMGENVVLIVKLLAAFALAFQFPMAVLVLVYMDLLSPATLKRYRRVAIVGIAVGAAMFTPPDPVSMIVMLLPLVLLYEGSIWVSYLVVRRKKKAAT